MYKIILFNKATKFYGRLDEKSRDRLNTAIENLKTNPFGGKDIKKLKGRLEGNYRLRVGDVRVVYQIDEKLSQIIIKAIGTRESIY